MRKMYLIPAVFLLFACNCMKNSNESKPVKSDLFNVLYSAQYQGRSEEESIVIHDNEAYNTLLQSVGSEEFPAVDFKKSQVVALFMGTKNTGGYAISIDRVEEEKDKIVVYKKVETPKPGEMVTMALSNPFVIAEIRSQKEIIFR